MANFIKTIFISNSQQISRSFARWTTKSPLRVISPEDYDPTTDKQINKSNKNSVIRNNNTHVQLNKTQQQKPLAITEVLKPKQRKKSQVDMFQTTIDADGNLIYTKMLNNDLRIAKIMSDIHSKNPDTDKQRILLEGKILIKEALEAKCKLKYILFSRIKDVEYLKPYLPKINANLYKMPYAEIQAWSDLTTSPGIIGIFEIPEPELIDTQNALPITIICDNIREPNNLGAILRNCAGVGCEKVILTKGCVNAWNQKVLRGACGAHFKVKIAKLPNWDDIESLLPKNSSVFIADNDTITANDNGESYTKNLVTQIPVLPYFGIDYTTIQHIVFIIGGETEGISETSYELAKKLTGVRVNIPLSNNLNSLNASSALGILLFEIKRQLAKYDSLKRNSVKA